MKNPEYHECLTTRILIRLGQRKTGRTILMSILCLGIPVNVYILAFFISTNWTASMDMIGSIFLAAQMVWIGPLLIYYYEVILLPRFWQEIVENKILSEQVVQEKAKNFTMLSKGFRKLLFIPWAILCVFAFALNKPVMSAIGVEHIPSVWFWPWAMWTLLQGLLTAFGFVGVIMMIRIINFCSSDKITLDPLHPDGLGGLSSFGTYAINTTLIFSSGAIFIPLGIKTAHHSGGELNLAYILIGLYSLAIAASFLIPTLLVGVKAKRVKDSMIRKATADLHFEKYLGEDSNAEINNLLKALVHRNAYMDIKAMGVYPFNTVILSQLFGSVFFPILIVYIQYLLRWI